MNNKIKQLDEKYQLRLLTKQHIQTLYNWNVKEKHFEHYTCRPLKLSQSFEEYAFKTLKSLSERKEKIYVLVKKGNCNIPLGKITLFDLNPRNHSAEFGYYLPNNNRLQGLGSIMLARFIQTAFNDNELNLNKVYATTSSNNLPSIKLLEKFGFKLDGRLREHYWINENKYDQLIYSMLKYEWTK
ncbi:GNAT family N-acetyltransferase [Clostridium ganghwense]|uniref:GNAT family protein n=1 Tax=Clostridium ganghwense TaxID=312089 RepID=A0ABT4CWT0_9CLOT|nr:GNAT family protein [Clostridium ganghwense]MCY6372626.1 GNAT family protein [Clostridium ganghwense]